MKGGEGGGTKYFLQDMMWIDDDLFKNYNSIFISSAKNKGIIWRAYSIGCGFFPEQPRNIPYFLLIAWGWELLSDSYGYIQKYFLNNFAIY